MSLGVIALAITVIFNNTFYAASSLKVNSLKVNPLSKITITSNSAILEKKQPNSSITYKDNVKTVFADNTIITSDDLHITLEASAFQALETNTVSQNIFKEITFRGKVFIVQKNRSIKSGVAKIYPEKKQCLLSGNVKVEQTKDKSNTIPIITTSKSASLDLNTNKITFLGTREQPVSTVINIEGHPALEKIKPRKHHEHNKNITSARSTKNSSRRSS